MSRILDLMEKRKEAWEGAKAFVESKKDKDGILSAEDAQTYDEMEAKVKAYSVEIGRLQEMEEMDKELSKPMTNAIVTRPMKMEGIDHMNYKKRSIKLHCKRCER